MLHPLIERAQREGTPLIDGETATFVWRGQNPPRVMGDFNDWERGTKPLKMKRAAPGVWAVKLELPRDAYLEYAFVRKDRRVRDPFNSHKLWNGINAYNHCFFMPEAAPTPLAKRSRSVGHGTVLRHIVRGPALVKDGRREVYFYRPVASDPYPLLVVYDGPDYWRRAQLTTLVDNLIAQQRIRPVALALMQNGGPERFMEYACSESTLAFLLTQVLPVARQRLNLIDPAQSPGAYGVLGASMGGLMALYTGLRLSHIFGKVLAQSGAYRTNNFDQVVFDLVQHGPLRPLEIWMDVGRYDMLELLTANRRMVDMLMNKGYRLTYREYNAGHNYAAWRNEIWRGLETLFGM